jgi:hypothetical protein
MFDWALMEQKTMEGLDPEACETLDERVRLQLGPITDTASPAGQLRHRAASVLVRLAVVLDPGAQAAFTSNVGGPAPVR